MPRKGKKKGGGKDLPVGMSPQTLPVGMSPQTLPVGMSPRTLPVGMSPQTLPVGMRQQVSPGTSQQTVSPGVKQQTVHPGARQQTVSSGVRQQTAHPVASQQTAPVTRQQSVSPQTEERAKPKWREISPERLGFKKKFQLSSPLPTKPGLNKSGKGIRLISNCFPLRIPSGNVYHYDVEIFDHSRMSTTTMLEKIEPKDKKFRCLNSKFNRKVFDKMVQDNANFRNVLPAYDGKKNMYARNPLEFCTKKFNCKVIIPDPDPEGSRDQVFWVYIQPVEKKETKDCAISLDPLHALFAGKVSIVPRETVMAIETVLKHSPCLRHFPLGQSFFYPPKFAHPLGNCKEIWFGYHQSMRLGQKTPMVNLDISASTFYQKGPLLNYVAAHLCRDIEGLHSVTSIKPISDLDNMLRNLQVETTHVRGYRRKYRIVKLTDKSASCQEFDMDVDGVTVYKTVADYFAERYRLILKFPNLPCVLMHPQNKKRFFPIEVCEVIAGQRYNRALRSEETAKMVKDTACPPGPRFKEIKLLHKEKASYSQDPYLKEFGFSVSSESLRVEGRQLIAPTIKYHENSTNSIVRPRNGSWDMRNKKFLEGARIRSWAFLSFGVKDTRTLREFSDALSRFAEIQGLCLGKCKDVSTHAVPRDVEYFDPFVEGILRNLKRDHQIHLAVVVIPMKLPGGFPSEDDKTKVLYRTVKDVAMRQSVISQCVKENNVNDVNPSLVSNILLKINAKMGGTNNSLTMGEMPSFMRDNIMVVGADVTHPSPTEDIACSLAAVVGSLNNEFSTYEVVTRAQINKADGKTSKEVIDDMTAIMLELLAAYRDRNGRNPSRIVLYRDGVSDGEFEEVQEKEVDKIRDAFRCVAKDYNPGITYIVMQKRHHVRTMPENPLDAPGNKGNPPPGTVVDTVITHPLNYDFFIYGHFGLQGTSRPAYLTVVRDDNRISPDDLHKMTYYLCHTYARCTKSISSPAPARYADQAAFMARQILLKYKKYKPKKKDPNDKEAPKLTKSELQEINGKKCRQYGTVGEANKLSAMESVSNSNMNISENVRNG